MSSVVPSFRPLARFARIGASVGLLATLTFGSATRCTNDSDSVVASILLTDNFPREGMTFEPSEEAPDGAARGDPEDEPKTVLVSKETIRVITVGGVTTDIAPPDGEFIGVIVENADFFSAADLWVQTDAGIYYYQNIGGGLFLEPKLVAAHHFKETDSGQTFSVVHDSFLGALISVATPVDGAPSSSMIRTYKSDLMGGYVEAGAPLTVPEVVIGMHGAHLDGDLRKDLAIVGGQSVIPLRRTAEGGLEFIDAATGQSPSMYAAGKVSMGTSVLGGAVCADISDDQLPDLIATGIGTLRVRLGLAGPGPLFGPVVTHQSPGLSGAREPIVIDLDDDNAPEVAHPNFGSASVSVWKGLGGGVLGARKDHTVADGPRSAFEIDANKDAYPDIGVVCANDHCFLGLINSPVLGGLASGVRLPGGARAIASGDMDGNMFADLAVCAGSDTSFYLNLGDGSGRLGAPIIRAPLSVFNHLVTVPAPGTGYDSRCYIIGAINGSGTIAALRATVNGQTVTFPTVQGLFAALPSTGLATGDLNVDGRIDVAGSHASSTTSFSIFTQQAGGGFAGPTTFAAAPGNWSHIVISNLDNAQGDDVALANPSGDVAIFLNNGAGAFTIQPALTFGLPIIDFAAVDLVGDNFSDLVALSGDGVRIRDNLPGLGYAPSLRFIPLPPGSSSFSFADADNDDLDDMFVSRALGADRNAVVEYFRNQGGSFNPDRVVNHASGGMPGRIVLADLHNAAQSRGASLPSTAGPEVIVANAGPAPRFEGVIIQPNIHDFAAQPVCTGDANGDNVVDFLDLNIVLSDFGMSGAPGSLQGDLDDDGDCDFIDLNIVLSAFGAPC